MKRLGIIGGTSLIKSKFFANMEPREVETEYGKVRVLMSADECIVFLQRHHADAGLDGIYRPPHLINHQANMMALKKLDVQDILAVCCVGSVKQEVTIGSIVIPDDFFNLFGGAVTMFDDGRGHIVPGMDDKLRHKMLNVLKATAKTLHGRRIARNRRRGSKWNHRLLWPFHHLEPDDSHPKAQPRRRFAIGFSKQ